MLDVTEQLRRYGDAVAETVDPVPFTGVDAVVTQAPHERGRRWPVLAAAALLALAVFAGIGWLAVRAEDDPPPADNPAPTNEVRPGVTMLDPGPLEPRRDAAVVWTGKEMVVWGGDIEAANFGLPGPDRAFADGAAYDPDTGAWRRMSASPLPNTMDGVTAAATERGIVFARGRKVALWDPERDTWRALDDVSGPLEPGLTPDLTSTGSQVVSVLANARLDPTTGRWTDLAPPPVTLERPVAAWNGSVLVVVGQRGFYTPGALALDPATESWRELPDPPGLNPAAVDVARVGDRLVFTDYEMGAVTLEEGPEGGSWEPVPSVPARFSESSPTISAVRDALVVTAPSAIAIRIGDGPWVPVPYGEIDFWSRAVVDDESLLVYGMAEGGRMRFARIDPVRLASEARTLQVGVVEVRLPDGVTMTDSAYHHENIVDWVELTFATPAGACTMTSQYLGIGGGSAPWTESDSGRTWSVDATTSDHVRITCDDATTARAFRANTTLPETVVGSG